MGALIACLAYLAVIGVAAYGWILNVVAVAHSDFAHVTGLLILRCFGIFMAPLGIVLGWFA